MIFVIVIIIVINMKNYTSLSSSPNTNQNTNYIRFNDNGAAGGGSGGLGGLGGLADNMAFKRFEKQETQQKREIHLNSGGGNRNQILYTTENIIQVNSSNNNNNNKSISDNQASFIPGEVVYKTIVIPFYICLMDIIIFNDLFVEIVDNGSIETKNKVLGSGRIRKYRLNGDIKNYDIFVEMENENVFHVKKRGILMRVRVSEDVRQLIINTMVNYVADGGDVDTKFKSKTSSSIIQTWDSIDGGSSVSIDSREKMIEHKRTGANSSSSSRFGCFGCFTSNHD